MKTKILLTALATFLFVNVNAFKNSASLEINLKQQKNILYLIKLSNGSSYETQDFLHLDNLKHGLNRIKIFELKFRKKARQRRTRNKLIFNGSIHLPKNTTVISKLVRKQLVVRRIIPNKVSHKPARKNRMKVQMRPKRFKNLIHTVKNESFDSHKLEIIEVATRKNRLSSRQVSILMNLFTFESYKLKFAKKAFVKTIDKENYFIVSKGLTFNSHKRELIKFINHR